MIPIRNTFMFIFFAHLTGLSCYGQSRCVNSKLKTAKLSTEVTENRVPVEFTCPGEFDPKTYTECCSDGACCEPSFLTAVSFNDEVFTITAILVIITCIILTILVVICCFWSRCPLYNTCRPNYSTTNVIVYSLSKDDPTPLMPAEANKGGQYHPCTVKIKKMQDV